MKHHCQRHLFLLSLAMSLGFAAVSYGQLPTPIVTSPELTPPQKAAVDTFIANQLKRLESPEVSFVQSGRNSLITTVNAPGASTGFFDYYAESLNKGLTPLAKSADARIRLNAAIVAAKVSVKTQNYRLAPVTHIFLQDGNEAVVLWGLQSAKVAVPQLLISTNTKQAVALGQDVANAAKAHSATAAVIEEAYRAVLLNATLGSGGGVDNVKSISAQQMVDFLPVPLSLLDFRVKLYDLLTPPEPLADVWGSNFCVMQSVWAAATPALRGQMLGDMLALVKGAAKQNGAAASKELLEVIQQSGKAFQVLGNTLKNADLQSAAQKLAAVNNTMTPPDIDAAVGKLEDAVKGLGLLAAQ